MFRKFGHSLFFCFILFAFRAAAQTNGQTAAPGKPKLSDTSNTKADTVEARVESYLRNSYAWGSDYQLKVGPTKPSPLPELLEVPFTVSMAEKSQTATVYVDKTGKFLIRGELSDMSVDPLADIRSKLSPGDSPSMGPENAKVTIIEFADFECPSCRQLDLILRDFMPRHPEARLVFKNFPLTEIHPWAMTAAIAGQCTYQQDPAKFWKIHDAIFDAQDSINPSNVWDKMIELGDQVGVNIDAFKICLADPATAKIIVQSVELGHVLNVTGTPTSFVNARRVVGPDQVTIEQYVHFEVETY
ncbi:MAG: thioredoxin domain-containing protein [Candidatus Acidiferrales bacterium]|jgi:protein-disulfide isomerase